MGTLTAKLTLTSNSALTDSLNLTLSDTLTTAVPSEMSRIFVLHSAATVLQAASTGTYYLYVKNIGTNSRVVDIRIADDSVFASLDIGEFCFIPMKADVGIELISLVGTEVVEYAYFKKG